MMWLKGCPRCQGDLFDEEGVSPEVYGTHFVNCLQCGYTLTSEQEAQLPRPERRRLSASAARRAASSAALRG